MTAFMLGIALLWIGLGTRFWELVGWAPEKDELQGRTTIRSWTKLFASLVGLILFVYAFPGITPVGLSAPGWFAAGVVLLVPGLLDFPWKQEMFKSLMDYDVDYTFGYTVVRTVAVILAVLCIGIGVGDGDPTDNNQSSPQAPTEQVQQAK